MAHCSNYLTMPKELKEALNCVEDTDEKGDNEGRLHPAATEWIRALST